jgi:hypothetical protein
LQALSIAVLACGCGSGQAAGTSSGEPTEIRDAGSHVPGGEAQLAPSPEPEPSPTSPSPAGAAGSGGRGGSGGGGETSAGTAGERAAGTAGERAAGGVANGGEATAGRSGATGSGGADAGAPTDPPPSSCFDEFECPELGTCSAHASTPNYLTPDEDDCVRSCRFDSDYEIRTQEDLDRLADLRCELVHGSIIVAAGGEVTSLDGLESLRAVTETFWVEQQSALRDLSALERLESVGTLNIEGSDALGEIELPALRNVTYQLEFFQLRELEIIRLPALQTVGDVIVTLNDALVSIELNGLEQATYFGIDSNPNLVTLNGLPALTELSSMIIQKNPKLPQCEVDELADRFGLSCSLTCNGNGSETTASCN